MFLEYPFDWNGFVSHYTIKNFPNKWPRRKTSFKWQNIYTNKLSKYLEYFKNSIYLWEKKSKVLMSTLKTLAEMLNNFIEFFHAEWE